VAASCCVGLGKGHVRGDVCCGCLKGVGGKAWLPAAAWAWARGMSVGTCSGDKFSQGEKSTDRLAVSKSLQLSAEEYMIRIELSSQKDKGYTITAIKTNKKLYNFRCGATAIGLDVPARQKDLIIGFAGNVQPSVDGTFFSNLQALHLKLNAFADEPAELQLNQ
jgi:hypothetical protein